MQADGKNPRSQCRLQDNYKKRVALSHPGTIYHLSFISYHSSLPEQLIYRTTYLIGATRRLLLAAYPPQLVAHRFERHTLYE